MFVYKLKRIDSSDCIKKSINTHCLCRELFFLVFYTLFSFQFWFYYFGGLGVGEKDGEGVENYVHFIVIKLNILIKPIFIFCIFIINQTINLNVYEIFYFTAHR